MSQPAIWPARILAIVVSGSTLVPLSYAGQPSEISAPTTAPSTQPIDAVQSAIDSRDYTGAVKLVGKMLAVHGPAAAGVSRFQLTMLKGDAQAGMKSIATAVITYKSAMKETKDPREIALAKWTVELFHIAESNVYTPKMITVGGPKIGPFDLMVPDQRKAALGLLLDDRLAALDPKLKTAVVSQNLPTIFPVLQQVQDLDQLDVIANGNDEKTTALASGLLDHSRNLLTNALKEYWARIGDIDTHANVTATSQTQAYINNALVTQSVVRKNGLSDSNKNELNTIVTNSQKIRDAATAFMQLAKNDSGWSTILSDSDRVTGKANDVLAEDFSDNVTTAGNDNNIGYGVPAGTQFGGSTVGVQGSGISAQATTPATPTKHSNAPSNPNTKTKSN